MTDNRIPAARIAGRIVEGGDVHDVIDPSTGAAIASVGWTGAADVEKAVSAGAQAFQLWSATAARERAAALRAIASDLRAQTTDIAPLLAAESGKLLGEAEGEVEFSAKYFDWFADAAVIAEEETGRTTANRRFRVRRHPVGVVAAVGTWNFPLSIPARKIAASIAAGCPTVLKPSERTPISADALVRICERHLPRGVIGQVIGEGIELTNALIDDPRVAAVTFTGSTPIGKVIAERAARTLTRACLELGGRAPFIVREDADVADAVEHLMVAKLRNNGESCIAANTLFVHASLAEEFRDALAARLAGVRPGRQEEPDADFGPLIDTRAVERLRALVAQAERAGKRVVRGPEGPDSGAFMPAVLVEDARDSELYAQEIFGPVLAMDIYEDEDALVSEINGWGVGLAGYVCGRDIAAAQELAERLRIGIVGINNGAPNTPEVPFGGFGDSGVGREGGLVGYDEFTELQTISAAR
ncbi:aldehyde dehydrogenase family protein [Brachybacterium kimchii]|uniref:Aldehyde dehydrogenase family protein n=1 Tax=Brachybacterium kimchii TaxID=2942909 RepID=A0ABY4N3Z2_9MICO|nr:aldehyde dehydrogenase family protein [Brachybacterium kimchii]UQN29282.1 aldehyde dehydrogenase family protein [Brachybacterium kimchii]